MRRLIAIPAVLATMLLAAPDAGGCSCEADVVPRLARADGGIVGTVVEKTVIAGGWRYSVAVERAYKGQAAPRVELVTTDSACSAAIDLPIGERKGFLLFGRGPEYELNDCTIVTPSQLAEAARPPAVGRRAGTARLLVEGDMRGSSHLVALSGRGRRLGSVIGSEGEAIDACPGGRYAVQAGERLHVIRMRDLRVIRQVELPGDVAVDVRCLGRSGRHAVALTFESPEVDMLAEPPRLVRVERRAARTVARAEGYWFSLGARALAAAAGAEVVATYDYGTGRRRIALRLAGVTGVSWSPDGRTLAALSSRADRSLLAVVRPGGRVARRRVELGGRAFDAPTWVTADRMAVVAIRASTGHLFTTDLRPAGALPGWRGSAVGGAGAVWWIDGGVVRRLPLDGGGARRVGRRIAGARSVTLIPGGGRVTAAPRAAAARRPTC